MKTDCSRRVRVRVGGLVAERDSHWERPSSLPLPFLSSSLCFPHSHGKDRPLQKKEKPLGATMQVHTVNTFPNTKNVCIFCIFCILCKCLKLWSEPVTLKVKRTSQSLCAYSSLGKSNNSWWWWWSGSCRITFRRERAHSCDTSSSAPQEVCSHTVLNAVQSPSMDCRWLIRRPFVRPLSSGYTGLDLKRPLGLILGAITHK